MPVLFDNRPYHFWATPSTPFWFNRLRGHVNRNALYLYDNYQIDFCPVIVVEIQRSRFKNPIAGTYPDLKILQYGEIVPETNIKWGVFWHQRGLERENLIERTHEWEWGLYGYSRMSFETFHKIEDLEIKQHTGQWWTPGSYGKNPPSPPKSLTSNKCNFIKQ